MDSNIAAGPRLQGKIASAAPGGAEKKGGWPKWEVEGLFRAAEECRQGRF